MKKSSSLQIAEKYLQNILYCTAIGKRLPPIRQMINESGASRKALEFFLKKFDEQQLIERRQRIGIIRTAGHGKRIYDVVACRNDGYIENPRPNFLSDTVQLLLTEGSRKGNLIRVHSIALGDSVERYVQIAQLRDSDGFILFLPNMIEIITLFKNTGKPVVAVFPEGIFPQIDQVFTATGSMEMQLNHLYAMGHRKILYMREEYTRDYVMTLMNRRLEYYRFMARKHLEVPEHWCSEYPEGGLEKALQKTFSKMPCPTGLIVHDGSVPKVYEFLRRNNFVIGKDVSVLATDGDRFLYELEPPITTVVAHSRQTVLAIWALLDKQHRGDYKPQFMEVMLTFRQGGSDGRPPQQPLMPLEYDN